MSFADVLSGLRHRLRSRNNSRRRQNPRTHLPAIAAEVLLLESRCLLSADVVGSGHNVHALARTVNNSSDLINFAGYQWYTNYHFNQDTGFYDNGQQWAPQNAFVDSNGHLHLELKTATVDGHTHLSSAEAVLVGNSSGQPVVLGYGTYLVAAQTSMNFNRLASNNGAIFGAFTYENLHGVGNIAGSQITGLPQSVIATLKSGMGVSGHNYQGTSLFKDGTTILNIQGDTVNLNQPAHRFATGAHTIYFVDQTLVNSHRELDMVEASRFGIQTDPTNAQFTLQPFNDNPLNVHRITLQDHGDITLVMNWKGPNQPVTFSEYNGIFDLNSLPQTPAITWVTPSSLNTFIPNSYNQQFHLNLWRAFWKNPPNPKPEEVTVMNFQFQPAS